MPSNRHLCIFSNLGLVKQANINDRTANSLLVVGAFGLGLTISDNVVSNNANDVNVNSFSAASGSTAENFLDNYSAMITAVRAGGSDASGQISQIQNTGTQLGFRYRNNGVWSVWRQVYHSGNTTKASDGTLKAASPVARIVSSPLDNQRMDVAEDGFSWCGCGTANEEAEGIRISRVDTGVYVLDGAAGLASSGWQLLPPMDPAGMGEMGVVEAEQADGSITIRLYARRYIAGEGGEILKTKGDPIDVPTNSWIDVRLDMPTDSAFNLKVNHLLQ